jgi:hypothetical protein
MMNILKCYFRKPYIGDIISQMTSLCCFSNLQTSSFTLTNAKLYDVEYNHVTVYANNFIYIYHFGVDLH